MPLAEHPDQGMIIRCDYTSGFCEPEMIKDRPVIVLSKKIVSRGALCTIVPLSKTPPTNVMQYHAQLNIRPKLPEHFESDGLWIKGDMVNAVSLHRLNFITFGKSTGKRVNYLNRLTDEQMKLVFKCILNGLGLQTLTKHL